MKIDKIITDIPFPELRGSLASIKYPALAEIKADGEFCYVHISNKETFTLNKYGKIRADFPSLNRFKNAVLRNHSSATFLAELFIDDGKLGCATKLLSNKTSDELKLNPFDILELDKRDLRNYDLIDRRETFIEVLHGNKLAVIKIVNSATEVNEHFKLITDAGFEGIVVKSLTGKLVLANCDWVKLKSKDRNDLKVLTVDSIQERIEVIHQSANQPVKVGVKCPSRYKKYIKPGDTVTIEHQGVTANGSLRHPVLIAKKEWI